MTRRLLPFALLLASLFTVMALLIRARPYDGDSLRALLNPTPDCPFSCFQGIQPGVTPLGQAVSLLENLGWDGRITATGFEGGVEFATWSGQGSDWLLAEATIGAQHNIVKSITLPTRIRFGDVWLMYNQVGTWSTVERGASLVYIFTLHDAGVTISCAIPQDAPNRLQRLLWAAVTVRVLEPEPAAPQPLTLREILS
jgi:hypothetical protein